MSYLFSALKRDYSYWFRKWKRRSLSKVKCSGILSYTFLNLCFCLGKCKRKHPPSFCIATEHLSNVTLVKAIDFSHFTFVGKSPKYNAVLHLTSVFVQSSHNASLNKAIVLHLGCGFIMDIECQTKNINKI